MRWRLSAGGPAGVLLFSLLDAEGVPHRAAPITGWTRENVNVAERVRRRQSRFVMPGPRLDEREWQSILDRLGTQDPPVRHRAGPRRVGRAAAPGPGRGRRRAQAELARVRAAIVLPLARGRALGEAIRFGVAAGAATVMNPGTRLCRAEDVDRLYAEVAVAPSMR